MDALQHGLEDERFQLAPFLQGSRRLDLSGIPWGDVQRYPLCEEELRCLQYMMDIESHTIVFLRDLIATRTVENPEITAFLSCWAYEEFWHGEAFSRFLGEAGYVVSPDFECTKDHSPLPSKVKRNAMIRSSPGGRGYGSFLITVFGSMISRDFPAVHMAWGAVNELATLTAYRRLITKTKHPVLRALLGTITRDEARHFSFYKQQAELRLERSKFARTLTRFALKNVWAPVGSGVRPREETDFVMCYLFGDDEGRAIFERLDKKVADLPGLQGLTLFTDALAAAEKRLGPVAERATPFKTVAAAG